MNPSMMQDDTYPAQLDQIAYMQMQIEDLQKRLQAIDLQDAKVVASHRPVKVRRVIQEVATATGLRFAAIVGDSRAKHITAARRAVIVRLREMGYSAPSVGIWMGVHHSTVLYHERMGKRS